MKAPSFRRRVSNDSATNPAETAPAESRTKPAGAVVPSTMLILRLSECNHTVLEVYQVVSNVYHTSSLVTITVLLTISKYNQKFQPLPSTVSNAAGMSPASSRTPAVSGRCRLHHISKRQQHVKPRLSTATRILCSA